MRKFKMKLEEADIPEGFDVAGLNLKIAEVFCDPDIHCATMEIGSARLKIVMQIIIYRN